MSINFDTVEVMEEVVTEWSRVLIVTVTLDGVEETNQVTLCWNEWVGYQLIDLDGWSDEAREFLAGLGLEGLEKLDEVTA